jgi:predicted phosphodiesterase
MARILAIGDMHEPACHPGYFKFCCDLYKQWKCNKVVFLGDVVDWQAISFHAKNPNLPGPRCEYELALSCLSKWWEAFPKASVCIGNHDARVHRIAESNGIPGAFLKGYNELWGTPKTWEWGFEFVYDGVFYFHGEGSSGVYAAFNAARNHMMPVVQGHAHSSWGVWGQTSPTKRIWGMNVGCGVDPDSLNMAYGKTCPRRPILGAGIIIDGEPHPQLMAIGEGEKYHRSKFLR